ncbi:MAG: hypothetical protein WAK16_06805 [Candidatus Cybelea sp.]
MSANAIDIFPLHGRSRSQIGAIPLGVASPYGLYVDKRERLYVVTSYAGVKVYAPRSGSVAPIATYAQRLNTALYPVVDGNGDLFVSIADHAESGAVIEFKAGSTSLYRVLTIPNSDEADGLDFDQYGNLYVAYRDEDGYASIEEFSSGSFAGKSLGMSLDQPQGLVVDNRNNILVVETGSADRIDLFAPGQSTPSVEQSVPGIPVQLAITRDERTLKVSTLSGDVFTMPYPFGTQRGVYLKDKTGSKSQGVALTDEQTFSVDPRSR